MNNKKTEVVPTARTGLGKYRARPQMFLLGFTHVNLQAELHGRWLPPACHRMRFLSKSSAQSVKSHSFLLYHGNKHILRTWRCPHSGLSCFWQWFSYLFFTVCVHLPFAKNSTRNQPHLVSIICLVWWLWQKYFWSAVLKWRSVLGR